MDIEKVVLELDLKNLTEEQKAWLHKLKNIAFAQMGQRFINAVRETGA